MNNRLTYATLICTLALVLPELGFGEGSNENLSLFGITVTNKTSEAETLFEYGSAYYTGDGAEKNAAKAMEYFKKAAELGHAKAQFNLAMCYMDTEIKEHSDAKAAEWLKKAFDQGVEVALYPLGICYYNLEQYKEAYAWALLAESKGDTRLKAMFDTMFTEEEIAAGKVRFEELKKQLAADAEKKTEVDTKTEE